MALDAIHTEWARRYRTRTDLALEAREVVIQHQGPPEIPGVAVETQETPVGTISRVAITTEAGARAMGKLPGHYTTIEAPALRQRDQQALEAVAALIAQELQAFVALWQVPLDGEVLVVGLGNWNATPDAVGPRTIHHLVVTRHFYYMAPPAARTGCRPVAGISPGVLGITGLETAEIVQGIVRQIQPALVVCIDALAARSTQRLGATVQIADAGIQPGSGVGNKRFGITRQTLGVPVLAIGVPTVVHALTVVADGLERMAAQGAGAPPPGLEEVLGPYMGDLIMTPKEIDVLVEDVAEVLAEGLNQGLHPDLDLNRLILAATGAG